MFEQLSSRLERFVHKLKGQGKITPQNVRETLEEVKGILLEADVSLPVVKDFLEGVSQRAMGAEVLESITPGQQMVKIIYDELVRILGGDQELLRLGKSPSPVMLVGLNGSGKTTTAAKLALYLKKKGRRPLLVAADYRRPAAVEQLTILGHQIGVPVAKGEGLGSYEVFRRARRWAEQEGFDTLILDTAGRMHVDDELMGELSYLYDQVKPSECLLVVDGMTGQDAIHSAQSFSRRLSLTGVILTKMEGDTRGGAALSLRYITGKPIKFVGVGERVEDLEAFHPTRIANRLLGKGDIVTLVERAQETFKEEKARAWAHKLAEDQFTLEDLRDQLLHISRMGPLESLISMIPGMGKLRNIAAPDERELKAMIAIINSMTPEERRNPRIIGSSRKQRIARGSGRTIQEVNRLLRQFEEMKSLTKMMKNLKKGKFFSFRSPPL